MKRLMLAVALLFFQTATVTAGPGPREMTFCFGDFAPFEYHVGDQFKGMNVEILESVAGKLGIAIHWEVYPWARCQHLATAGEVDGLMSLYRTAEREKHYFFPDENINIDECVFFTFPGSHVHFDGSLESLSGMTVLIAQANAYGQDFDAAQNIEKVTAPNTVNVVRMIAGKRFKIGIGSREAVENEIRRHGYADELVILEPPYTIKTYFALSKRRDPAYEDLAEDLSDALKAFKQTRDYDRILEKYGYGDRHRPSPAKAP